MMFSIASIKCGGTGPPPNAPLTPFAVAAKPLFIEYLNNEVKANTQKSYRARDQKELETQLRTYLDETRQHEEQSDRYFLVS
jgi:hypothetical protein